jgi:hypothetical protein
VPTDEKMIQSLQVLGQHVEACPDLPATTSMGEQLSHAASVRLWRARLFMQWQLACVQRVPICV